MLRQLAIASTLVLGFAGAALAQSFPARPVHVIVPYAAGGGVDVLARSIGAGLSERWNQPVVIENKTGAGGNIGADAAARAQPDGYTLLATTSSTFTANRFLYKSLPYDPDKSFAPVTLLVQSDQFVLANADVPAKDLKELVGYSRKNPDALNYGSWGRGSEPQLTYEFLNAKEGLKIVHVPYKGVAPVLKAITAGEVQLTMGSAGVAGRLVKAGRVKQLAIAATKRSSRFPEVPTTAELGFPYLRAAIQIGLWAPAGTPKAVIDKINADVHTLLNTPEFAEKAVTRIGFDVAVNSPDELNALLREETARIAEVVKAARIQPE